MFISYFLQPGGSHLIFNIQNLEYLIQQIYSLKYYKPAPFKDTGCH